MARRYNNPYEEEGVVSSVLPYAFLGGVATAGVYAWKQPAKTEQFVKSTFDKVFPMTKPDLNIKTSKVMNLNASITKASILARQSIKLKQAQIKARSVAFDNKFPTLKKYTTLTENTKNYINQNMINDNLAISSLADIEGVGGISLGQDLQKAVEAKFGPIKGHSFRGTTVTFHTENAGDIFIPTSIKDGAGWTRVGSKEGLNGVYASRLTSVIDGGKERILGPNELWLEMLRGNMDEQMARAMPDDASKTLRIMKKIGKDPAAIAKSIEEAKAGKELYDFSKPRDFEEGSRALFGTHEDPIASRSAIGDRAKIYATMDIDPVSYERHTGWQERLSIPSSSDRLKDGGEELKNVLKFYESTNGMPVELMGENGTWLSLDQQGIMKREYQTEIVNRIKNRSSIGSQSSIAEGARHTEKSPGMNYAERHKSNKGYVRADRRLNKIPKSKVLNRFTPLLRPSSEVMEDVIPGGFNDIFYGKNGFLERGVLNVHGKLTTSLADEGIQIDRNILESFMVEDNASMQINGLFNLDGMSDKEKARFLFDYKDKKGAVTKYSFEDLISGKDDILDKVINNKGILTGEKGMSPGMGLDEGQILAKDQIRTGDGMSSKTFSTKIQISSDNAKDLRLNLQKLIIEQAKNPDFGTNINLPYTIIENASKVGTAEGLARTISIAGNIQASTGYEALFDRGLFEKIVPSMKDGLPKAGKEVAQLGTFMQYSILGDLTTGLQDKSLSKYDLRWATRSPKGNKIHSLQSILKGKDAMEIVNSIAGRDVLARQMESLQALHGLISYDRLNALQGGDNSFTRGLVDIIEENGQKFALTKKVMNSTSKTHVRGKGRIITEKFALDDLMALTEARWDSIEIGDLQNLKRKMKKAYPSDYATPNSSQDSMDIEKKLQEKLAAREVKTKALASRSIEVHEGGKVYTKPLNVSFNSARSNDWGYTASLLAHETSRMSTGTTFNTMRIPIRDMNYFINRPELAHELMINNAVDSEKLALEFKLMENSLDGNLQDFGDQGDLLKRYEDKIGQKIQDINITTEEGRQKLYNLIGGETRASSNVDFMTSISDPEKAMGTLLSSEHNPAGVRIFDGNKNIFFGSAEMLGGVYQMPGEKGGTIDSFTNLTMRTARNIARSGKIGEDDLKNYREAMIANSISSKSGFYDKMAPKIAGARYVGATIDTTFSSNEVLTRKLDAKLKPGEFGEEIVDLFHGITEEKSTTFRQSLEQKLADLELKINNKLKGYGNWKEAINTEGATFLNQHIDKLNNTKNIRDTAGKISKEYEQVSNQIRGMFKKYAESKTAENYNNLIDTIEKKATSLFGFRHPTVYETSGFESIHLSGAKGLSYKQDSEIAFGKGIRRAIRGDIDGDKIMTFQSWNALNNKKTMDYITGFQKQGAALISLDPQKVNAKALFGGDDIESFFSWRSAHSLDLASTMMEAEKTSVWASYMTKSLTGSMNIRAGGAKNIFRQLAEKNGLSSQEITEADLFFGSITSAWTEQQAISSKNLDMFIKDGKIKSNFDSITDFFGGRINKAVKESFADSKGLMSGIGFLQAMLVKDQGAAKLGLTDADYESAKLVELSNDYSNNWRKINEEEFGTLVKARGTSSSGLQTYADYEKHISDNGIEFWSEKESIKKMFAGEKVDSFMDAIYFGMKKGKSTVTENIFGVINAISDKINKISSSEEFLAMTAEHLRDTRRNINRNAETLIGDFSQRVPQAKRGFILGKHFERVFSYFTETGKAMPRLGGAAAIGLAGFTALNLLFGDGAPQNPNDLPSVNNPSFDRSAGGMRVPGNSQFQTGSTSYGSTTLLTDSSMSMSDAISYAKSSIGFSPSTISATRTDGQDPYKYDMMQYRG